MERRKKWRCRPVLPAGSAFFIGLEPSRALPAGRPRHGSNIGPRLLQPRLHLRDSHFLRIISDPVYFTASHPALCHGYHSRPPLQGGGAHIVSLHHEGGFCRCRGFQRLSTRRQEARQHQGTEDKHRLFHGQTPLNEWHLAGSPVASAASKDSSPLKEG
jgi:hypothetical protein